MPVDLGNLGAAAEERLDSSAQLRKRHDVAIDANVIGLGVDRARRDVGVTVVGLLDVDPRGAVLAAKPGISADRLVVNEG